MGCRIYQIVQLETGDKKISWYRERKALKNLRFFKEFSNIYGFFSTLYFATKHSGPAYKTIPASNRRKGVKNRLQNKKNINKYEIQSNLRY